MLRTKKDFNGMEGSIPNDRDSMCQGLEIKTSMSHVGTEKEKVLLSLKGDY